jgi:hypothetical protein
MDVVMPNIFISYSDKQKDIAENFKARLIEYNIEAWLYSIDKTLAVNCWKEIKNVIESSRLIVFLISQDTLSSKGQMSELKMSLKKLKNIDSKGRLLPIVYGDVTFADLPEELKHINGLSIDAYSVKETAYKVASDFFPELFENYRKSKWIYPRPGQWLRIASINPYMREKANLGDIVYFRRISPLGLFECFYPKINELFCFAPNDLQSIEEIDQEYLLEREYVPKRYRISTMINIEWIGLRTMEKSGKIELPPKKKK